MMEIHGRLALMLQRIGIQELLVSNPGQLAESETRCEPLHPGEAHPVLCKCDITDGPLLVNSNPGSVVVLQAVSRLKRIWHSFSFLRR